MESVLAGYGYMHMADSPIAALDFGLSNHRSNWQLAKGDGSVTDHAPGQQHNADPEAVQIFLDIEPAESWSFLMHPGAFRRIIMNLFGNSLKFTKAGFIRVHLRQETPPNGSDKRTTAGFGKILLTVSDSGKGISQEYLRNHLYTPFAQEDHFAPGTGLGLSLVRQVVTALGGEIHVNSQIGRGTAVTVSLPLPSGEVVDEEEASFRAVMQDMAGLRVVVRGNEQATAAKEVNLGYDGIEPGAQAKSQLQLIESMCRGWLKMNIVSQTDLRGSAPDVVISTQESFSDLEADATSDPARCPHIFVCRSSRVVESLTDRSRMPAFFEVVSQPLGPRKLTKSLFDSRRRWKEAQNPLPKPDITANPPEKRPLLLSTPSQAAELTAVLKVAGIIDERAILPPSAIIPDHGQPATQAVTEPTAEGVVSKPPGTLLADTPSGTDFKSVEGRRSVLIVDDNPINRKVCSPPLLSDRAKLTVLRYWKPT